MRVAELLEALEALDPDAEVRVAYQPQYPVWFPVGGLSVVKPAECEGCVDGEPCPSDDADDHDGGEDGTVYLLQSQWESGGYASAKVFDEWAVD